MSLDDRTAVEDPEAYPALSKAHTPGQPWEWAGKSVAEKEAREVLTA